MSGRAAIRRILIRWVPLLGVGLFFVNCSGQTGPEEQFGRLALIPEFESSAAYIVPVDSLRITLTRSDSTTIALDTVIGLAGQDSVDLEIPVTLLAQTETFFLVLKIVNAAGDTVFSAGPDVVTATSGSATATPTPVTIVYVGVGSDADSVRITTPGASVLFGETVLLEAIALDSVGVAIPETPIRWISTDEAQGTFPDDEIGRLVGGNTRGPLTVIAELLTGPADTVTVLVQPVPSAVVIVSGNNQSGDIQTELTDPIVVQVNASDGLGMQDVSVAFSTPDGGTLTPDAVITDAQGQAATAWVLGSAEGAQTATAEVVGAATVQATIDATAIQRVATDLAIVSGDAQTGTVGVELTNSLVVLATDITGQPVGGTTIDWAVTVNNGTANPAASVTDANGLAATAWTLGTTTGANAITASLPAVAGPSTDVSEHSAAGDKANADAAAAPVVTFTATANSTPIASITSPANGAVFLDTEAITFNGTATDADDGALTGASLVWTSSLDGEIGTGIQFTKDALSLSVGTHTITLTATDSFGATATASISITVNQDLTAGSISGRVFRSQDDAPFAGVRVVRSGPGGDTEVVTDASGNYGFSSVPVGTHSVSVMSVDLPPFGSFVVSGEQQVTITGGLVVEDVDFAFRAAEVEVRTIADVSNVGVGAEVEITVELDLTEIPLPLSGINGTIEWPTAVAGLVPGSATAGDVWAQTSGNFLTNESPPGTLLFVGVSPTTGIVDDVFTVMTFRVTAVAAGSADFAPNFAELEVFDPATGASTKLLDIVFLRTTTATVTVQ